MLYMLGCVVTFTFYELARSVGVRALYVYRDMFWRRHIKLGSIFWYVYGFMILPYFVTLQIELTMFKGWLYYFLQVV